MVGFRNDGNWGEESEREWDSQEEKRRDIVKHPNHVRNSSLAANSIFSLLLLSFSLFFVYASYVCVVKLDERTGGYICLSFLALS